MEELWEASDGKSEKIIDVRGEPFMFYFSLQKHCEAFCAD